MMTERGGMIGRMTDPYGKDFGRPSLADFLLARIDAWEAFWRTASSEQHLGRALVRTMLAECAAKRRIVERARALIALGGSASVVGEDILRDLALPYADHPDYRDEWR